MFQFADVQLSDAVNFFGGATSLDSLLKAHKTSEAERFFTYEWFDQPDKKPNRKRLSFDAFYSKMRSCKPLETNYKDYVNLMKSELSIGRVVIELKQSKPPPLRIEKCQNLQET